MARKRMTPYGTIEGGVCDRIHEARAKREIGARLYLDELENRGGIQSNNGWLRAIKLPKVSEEEVYAIGGNYGADVEIGYRRFNGVIGQLHKQNKAFRRNWLERWLEDICSFEFAVKADNPLSILGMGNIEFGYASSHLDHIYQERKEDLIKKIEEEFFGKEDVEK